MKLHADKELPEKRECVQDYHSTNLSDQYDSDAMYLLSLVDLANQAEERVADYNAPELVELLDE